MQDGMKSQAIWEHTVISHVIRFTDMNSWLLSSGLISSSPMSLTGGKCWLQSITKQHQSGDPSAASPSPSRISHACGYHCFPLQFEPVPTRRQVFVATWAHCPPHSHHHGSTATDGVRDSMELDATAAAVQDFMQQHTQLAGAPLKSVASQIKEAHVIVTPLSSIVIVAKPGSNGYRSEFFLTE